MYQVVIEKQAQKQLAKISPPHYQSIAAALQNLAINPRPNGYKKLKGRPGFRVRIGDYRIIYNMKITSSLFLCSSSDTGKMCMNKTKQASAS